MAASVLLVDDSRNLREFCGRMLTCEGYRVALAASGEEALERLPDEPVDVVILDIRLPGASGLELVQRFAAWAPVVLHSAHREAFDDARACFASACVEKHEDLAGLKAALRLVLRDRTPWCISPPN